MGEGASAERVASGPVKIGPVNIHVRFETVDDGAGGVTPQYCCICYEGLPDDPANSILICAGPCCAKVMG
jgi:hypothetical protein